MKVIYYYDEPPNSYTKSIFLAGPSPRTSDTQSWRPEALRILEAKGFDGVVFVPEPKPGDNSQYEWSKAPKWEHRMLDMADIVLFWVPRDISILPNDELKLPGFTTNVEFGHWVNSGKAVLGYPPRAPHTSYLRFMADEFHVPTLFTLEDTVDSALKIIGDGALRRGGERDVPLLIWNTNSFQSWYSAQKSAGNRLDGAKFEWIFKVGKNKDIVFYWAIHANIYIAKENRNKVNEIVISRFDISSILLWYYNIDLFKTKVILVREFRSPGRTSDGFVHELPGGSSTATYNPNEVMAEELKEEVGLKIDPSRLQKGQSRQLAATMSTHKANLFTYELNDEELQWLNDNSHIPHGADLDNPTGERTLIEVKTVGEILSDDKSDFATVGMVMSGLLNAR